LITLPSPRPDLLPLHNARQDMDTIDAFIGAIDKSLIESQSRRENERTKFAKEREVSRQRQQDYMMEMMQALVKYANERLNEERLVEQEAAQQTAVPYRCLALAPLARTCAHSFIRETEPWMARAQHGQSRQGAKMPRTPRRGG